MSDDDSENLPVLHDSENPRTIEDLRAELAREDGYLSPSNAHVPERADDIGDVPVPANPDAHQLGGVAVAECDVERGVDGLTWLVDGDVGPTAQIGIDPDWFIEDIEDWA